MDGCGWIDCVCVLINLFSIFPVKLCLIFWTYTLKIFCLFVKQKQKKKETTVSD